MEFQDFANVLSIVNDSLFIKVISLRSYYFINVGVLCNRGIFMAENEVNQAPVPVDSSLSITDNLTLLRGMFSPEFFMKSTRPLLYKKANNDPERVHELVLEMITNHKSELALLSNFFRAPEELKIKINGQSIVPFGAAAGLDKTGDSLLGLSNFFGFLEPGTICVNPRPGNNRPRVATDDANLDLYNAQGFPGKGLEYFLNNLKDYKRQKGKVPVYINICGMPLSEQDAVNFAMDEMKQLLTKLEPYADGFVWNCASPNTEALKLLREPGIFNETSKLIKELAPNKLRLVKMWPYEPEEKATFLNFVKSFMDGGGHGVITTNTKIFPKEQIPAPNWGYKSAGRSGIFLRPYRLRSVKDLREAFPDAIIVATGGIYDGDDAYETFKIGADMLEGYTPYTFYGLGLLAKIEKRVAERLRQDKHASLEELRSYRVRR